ncbi:integrase core domain-containing protein [Pseudomonas chlororaphis]|uniref:integrase core domain-containing protein n=1 Tax=Pseudomonas chlororaphis TaxID=587753 RepID=UPI0039F17BFC
MERFFGSLKSEWVPETGYSSEHEARADVQRYVTRYNTSRPHSYNDYRSPVAGRDGENGGVNLNGCPGLVDLFTIPDDHSCSH